MINYNRKLSNERETQVPSHRMSTLALLETIIFIKIVRSFLHKIGMLRSFLNNGGNAEIHF